LTDQGNAKLKKVRKDEYRGIKKLHKRIAAVTIGIETIKDDPEKMEAMMGAVEEALKPALKEYWDVSRHPYNRTVLCYSRVVGIRLLEAQAARNRLMLSESLNSSCR
jgi:hypothetical protein